MMGKKTRPVIGKLITGMLVYGNQSRLMEVVTTSPKTSLEFKTQSPRGLKNYDNIHVGGVGLGIVAALEKSGCGGGDIPAKKAICCRNLSRSDPIPVSNPSKHGDRGGGVVEMENERDSRSMEEYTYVTCHKPNKSSHTKVYRDGEYIKGCNYDKSGYNNTKKSGAGVKGGKGGKGSFFDISPARLGDTMTVYPASDFLSSCHLCQKNLDGKDIYMYRGEKAFCSTECRYKQIGMDERREQYCSSEAYSRSSSAHVSIGDHMFSTGILAI